MLALFWDMSEILISTLGRQLQSGIELISLISQQNLHEPSRTPLRWGHLDRLNYIRDAQLAGRAADAPGTKGCEPTVASQRAKSH